MDLADKLVILRKESGWTQAIAAKKITIQQSYLSKLESGQYQPSEEVINNICLAYNVKPEELLPPPIKNSNSHNITIFSCVIGLIFILLGYFSLVFPQTYYTYKVKSLVGTTSQQLINYHVSDHYQGEKYLQVFDDVKYEYSLVAQRDISRAENRWLIALGCLFVFIPTITSIYRYKAQRK